ncbi:MAG TPA: methyltransferase [Polyangiaceae bacterium]|nr:methyltransferase [Polyangiaceae bacterium]
MTIDPSNTAAFRTIRDFLDERMYPLVDLRLSLEVGRSMTGFPPFDALDKAVERLDFEHEILFRLFRLGSPVDDDSIRRALPGRVLEAFHVTGLLVRGGDQLWRTPNLLLVPAEGLMLIVSVPPTYPTASGNCDTWFDMSSYFLAKALPTSLAGKRVLDLCSGSGIQGLLCAARAADQVVGLELSPNAVQVARANAILNGLEGRIEFRESDGLSALAADERFDLVVCNTPYAPILPRAAAPTTVGEIGNAVLQRTVSQLAAHVREHGRGILATWRSPGRGSVTDQLNLLASVLESQGCSVSAYVDRAPDTVDGVVRMLQKDLEQRGGLSLEHIEPILAATRDTLGRAQPPIDGFYNQLVCFQKIDRLRPETVRPTFGLSAAG